MRCDFKVRSKSCALLCATLLNTGKIPGLFSVVSVVGLSTTVIAAQAQSEVSVIDFEYPDPEKGFGMQVPSDWKIEKDYSGYAVFMEPKEKIMPTAENPVVADPNITVSATRDPMFIDEENLEAYATELQEKFTAFNGASDLQIFQKSIAKNLPGDKQGLLYYLTYRKNGFDVVSAILIMSNEKVRYRVTLTDYKVGFDKNLERYYPIMASLAVKGNAPVRVTPLQQAIPWLSVLGGLILLIGGGRFVVGKRARSKLERFTAENDDISHGPMSHAPMSQAPHSFAAASGYDMSQAPMSSAGSSSQGYSQAPSHAPASAAQSQGFGTSFSAAPTSAAAHSQATGFEGFDDELEPPKAKKKKAVKDHDPADDF